MVDKLDLLIKNVLQDEARKAPEPEEVYPEIRESLLTYRMSKTKMSKYSIPYRLKQKLTVAVSCAIILGILIFSFSESSRSFALEALNSIRTIFTAEKVDGKYKLVKKPSNEVFIAPGVCSTTYLADEDLIGLLGYKVKFPLTVAGEYQLRDRALGVSLQKNVDYDTGEKIQDLMFKAIDSDQEMNKLKKYSPKRNACGSYTKNDGSYVFIITQRIDDSDSIEKRLKLYSEANGTKFKEVKVNGLKGYWIEYSYPVYPFIMGNGAGKSDMTLPPIEIKEMQSLLWDSGNVSYTITRGDKTELPLEKALEIAEDFQKEQPLN